MASSAVIGALRVLLSADTAAFEKALSGADASTKKLANTMKRDLEPSQTRINQLVRQFAGTKEIGLAENYARAIKDVGGAANLTAKHQEQANAAVQKAIAHYAALGKTAPAHLLEIEKATRKLEAPTKQLGVLGTTVGRLAGAFTVAGLAERGISAVTASLGDMVAQGAKLDGLRSGFERLTKGIKVNGDEMLDAMQDGTRGLVTNVDLFQSANKAMLLGLPVTTKSMGEMSKAATALGRAMGLDATKSLDDMITALGRVSPLILDNLGLTVKVEEANKKYAASLGKNADDLTEAEKKMAFYNAAMDAAKKKTEELGEPMLTMTDRLAQGWTKVANAVAEVSSALNKMLGAAVSGPPKKAPSTAGSASSFGAAKVGGSDFVSVHAQAAEEIKKALAEAPIIAKAAGAVITPEVDEKLKQARKAVDDLIKSTERLNKEKEKAAKIAAQTEEAYKGWLQSLLGLSKAEKQQLDFEKRAIHEGHLPYVLSLMKMSDTVSAIVDKQMHSKLAKSIMDVGNAARLAADQITAAQRVAASFSLIRPIEGLFVKGMSVADLMKGVNTSNTHGLFSGMQAAVDALPQTIMQAFTGRGNVGKSIGGLLAGAMASGFAGEMKDGLFTSGVGKVLQKSLGKTLGGALGSFIPGIGTLLGGLLGGGLDKIFGPGEGARVNDMRDQFVAAKGGWEAMHAEIAAMGGDPQLTAILNRLYFTGKEGDFKTGMAQYEARLKQVQAALAQTGAKMNALVTGAEKFGGVLPKSMHAAAQQILGMTGLTGDLRKQLEKLIGQPSWQVLEERADALGIDKGGLGAGFNQAKVKDLALGFVRDIQMFADAGADADTVLRGMSDEISNLLVEARKTGAQLPKTLEPFIKRLSEMGLLIDENGNAIDAGAFSFADFEDEALIAMRDLLTEIKDILAKAFPAAADLAARAIEEMGRGIFGWRAHLPSAMAGDGAAATPWMPPVLSSSASLTPNIATAFDGGAVAGGGTFNIYALDSQSFETYLRRGGADTIARTLPDATARYVGKR